MTNGKLIATNNPDATHGDRKTGKILDERMQ